MSRRRVLCVFPNDPLEVYVRKGEIKLRYFNPDNYFDEVHVITMAERDADPSEVQTVAGRAALVIHPVGALNRLGWPKGFALGAYRRRVLETVRAIRPDAIRAYNPLLAGRLAVWCGRELGTPSVISLHGNYDEDLRALFLRQGKWLHFAKYLVFRWATEPYALRHADHVICAYEFPALYARRYRSGPISVIYNRVDTARFRPADPARAADARPMCILTVGRLVSEKNPACLIQAIKGLPVHLTIIGDGEQRDMLRQLAHRLGVAEQITWIPSVPNGEVHRYYQESDVFAIALCYGGVSIPVLEALASGLPVIRSESGWPGDHELRGDYLVCVQNTPEAFRDAFRRLLENPRWRQDLAVKARQAAQAFDAASAEAAERAVYERLIAREEALAA